MLLPLGQASAEPHPLPSKKGVILVVRVAPKNSGNLCELKLFGIDATAITL